MRQVFAALAVTGAGQRRHHTQPQSAGLGLRRRIKRTAQDAGRRSR
jgi:hypothetical protein